MGYDESEKRGCLGIFLDVVQAIFVFIANLLLQIGRLIGAIFNRKRGND